MTCIVGLVEDGVVYMGGDSLSSDGYSRGVTALRKVFRVGEFLIGYTDSFRMGQILQYHLKVREQRQDETDEQYLVVAFIEAVRECLKEKGYARVNSNEELGGHFLLGYRGCVYQIGSDFQVNHSTRGFAACGSGETYALATLLALKDIPPRLRVLRALEVSAELCAMVCAPFHIEVLEPAVEQNGHYDPKQPLTIDHEAFMKA